MEKKLQKNIYELPSPGILVKDIRRPNPDPLSSVDNACVYWMNHLEEALDEHSQRFTRLDQHGSAVLHFLRKHLLH